MEAKTEQQVMSLKTEATGMMQWANGLTVSTQETANDAMQRLSVIKGMRKKVVDWFAPMKTAAAAAHKAIVAREKEITDVADQAEQVVKAKVISWQQEEARKAEAERRRLQAIADEKARREREAAEAAAAKQRAIEAAQRAAAESARRAAEQASAADRARLQAEAAEAERKANAAAAKAEAKDEAATAVVAPVIEIVAPAATAAGTSSRKTYRAVLVDKTELVNAAAFGGPDCLAAQFLTFDQKAADGIARAMKGAAKVAGVRFEEVAGLSVRAQ